MSTGSASSSLHPANDSPTYVELVLCQITRSQCVCLGNDRNQIDSGTKVLHDLDIERLQSGVYHQSFEQQGTEKNKATYEWPEGLIK